MNDSGRPAASWYPDPTGRYEYRWFDGSDWTDQVSSKSVQSIDALSGAPGAIIPARDMSAEKVTQHVARAGVEVGALQGGGTLFTEPILVVNQKAKLIELNNEYAISDQHGNQISAVREVGQSTAKKVVRFFSNVDQFLTHKYQVVDLNGQIQMQLTRPAKFVKSKVIVEDGSGNPIGEIVQENVFGKIHFGMMVGGARIGSIDAQNWRAWDFTISDEAGSQVAKITKTFGGVARAMFTTADNYVIQIEPHLEGPLLMMTLAAAVTVDTALKQDS